MKSRYGGQVCRLHSTARTQRRLFISYQTNTLATMPTQLSAKRSKRKVRIRVRPLENSMLHLAKVVRRKLRRLFRLDARSLSRPRKLKLLRLSNLSRKKSVRTRYPNTRSHFLGAQSGAYIVRQIRIKTMTRMNSSGRTTFM